MNVRVSNKAVIIRDGKLLVTENKDDEGLFYCLPGGGQEHGETVHEALKRECLEETGLVVEVGDLLYLRDYIGRNHTMSDVHPDVHQVEPMFLCDIINDDNAGKGISPDSRQTGVVWLEINKLDAYRIYPEALKRLIPNIGKEKQSIYLGDVN